MDSRYYSPVLARAYPTVFDFSSTSRIPNAPAFDGQDSYAPDNLSSFSTPYLTPVQIASLTGTPAMDSFEPSIPSNYLTGLEWFNSNAANDALLPCNNESAEDFIPRSQPLPADLQNDPYAHDLSQFDWLLEYAGTAQSPGTWFPSSHGQVHEPAEMFSVGFPRDIGPSQVAANPSGAPTSSDWTGNSSSANPLVPIGYPFEDDGTFRWAAAGHPSGSDFGSRASSVPQLSHGQDDSTASSSYAATPDDLSFVSWSGRQQETLKAPRQEPPPSSYQYGNNESAGWSPQPETVQSQYHHTIGSLARRHLQPAVLGKRRCPSDSLAEFAGDLATPHLEPSSPRKRARLSNSLQELAETSDASQAQPASSRKRACSAVFGEESAQSCAESEVGRGSKRRRVEQASHQPAPEAPQLQQTQLLALSSDRPKRTKEEEDDLIVELRDVYKLTFREIKIRLGLDLAESTLRGRYRARKKLPQERLRCPPWTDNDVRLLKEAMAAATSALEEEYALASGKKKKEATFKWKTVVDYLQEHGAAYDFKYAACRKKWAEISSESS